eukprot:4999-Heterococcus_DN1.PRE.3
MYALNMNPHDAAMHNTHLTVLPLLQASHTVSALKFLSLNACCYVVLFTVAVFLGASSLETAKSIVKRLNSAGTAAALGQPSLKQAKLDAMTQRERKLAGMREKFLATGVAFDGMTFASVQGRYVVLNALRQDCIHSTTLKQQAPRSALHDSASTINAADNRSYCAMSAWDVIHKHHVWTGIVAGSSSVAETSSGDEVMTSAAAWQTYRHRRLNNAQYALLAMTHVLSLMALQTYIAKLCASSDTCMHSLHTRPLTDATSYHLTHYCAATSSRQCSTANAPGHCKSVASSYCSLH